MKQTMSAKPETTTEQAMGLGNKRLLRVAWLLKNVASYMAFFFLIFLNVVNQKEQTSVSHLPVMIGFIVFSSKIIERIQVGKSL